MPAPAEEIDFSDILSYGRTSPVKRKIMMVKPTPSADLPLTNDNGPRLFNPKKYFQRDLQPLIQQFRSLLASGSGTATTLSTTNTAQPTVNYQRSLLMRFRDIVARYLSAIEPTTDVVKMLTDSASDLLVDRMAIEDGELPDTAMLTRTGRPLVKLFAPSVHDKSLAGHRLLLETFLSAFLSPNAVIDSAINSRLMDESIGSMLLLTDDSSLVVLNYQRLVLINRCRMMELSVQDPTFVSRYWSAVAMNLFAHLIGSILYMRDSLSERVVNEDSVVQLHYDYIRSNIDTVVYLAERLLMRGYQRRVLFLMDRLCGYLEANEYPWFAQLHVFIIRTLLFTVQNIEYAGKYIAKVGLLHRRRQTRRHKQSAHERRQLFQPQTPQSPGDPIASFNNNNNNNNNIESKPIRTQTAATGVSIAAASKRVPTAASQLSNGNNDCTEIGKAWREDEEWQYFQLNTFYVQAKVRSLIHPEWAKLARLFEASISEATTSSLGTAASSRPSTDQLRLSTANVDGKRSNKQRAQSSAANKKQAQTTFFEEPMVKAQLDTASQQIDRLLSKIRTAIVGSHHSQESARAFALSEIYRSTMPRRFGLTLVESSIATMVEQRFDSLMSTDEFIAANSSGDPVLQDQLVKNMLMLFKYGEREILQRQCNRAAALFDPNANRPSSSASSSAGPTGATIVVNNKSGAAPAATVVISPNNSNNGAETTDRNPSAQQCLVESAQNAIYQRRFRRSLQIISLCNQIRNFDIRPFLERRSLDNPGSLVDRMITLCRLIEPPPTATTVTAIETAEEDPLPPIVRTQIAVEDMWIPLTNSLVAFYQLVDGVGMKKGNQEELLNATMRMILRLFNLLLYRLPEVSLRTPQWFTLFGEVLVKLMKTGGESMDSILTVLQSTLDVVRGWRYRLSIDGAVGLTSDWHSLVGCSVPGNLGTTTTAATSATVNEAIAYAKPAIMFADQELRLLGTQLDLTLNYWLTHAAGNPLLDDSAAITNQCLQFSNGNPYLETLFYTRIIENWSDESRVVADQKRRLLADQAVKSWRRALIDERSRIRAYQQLPVQISLISPTTALLRLNKQHAEGNYHAITYYCRESVAGNGKQQQASSIDKDFGWTGVRQLAIGQLQDYQGLIEQLLPNRCYRLKVLLERREASGDIVEEEYHLRFNTYLPLQLEQLGATLLRIADSLDAHQLVAEVKDYFLGFIIQSGPSLVLGDNSTKRIPRIALQLNTPVLDLLHPSQVAELCRYLFRMPLSPFPSYSKQDQEIFDNCRSIIVSLELAAYLENPVLALSAAGTLFNTWKQAAIGEECNGTETGPSILISLAHLIREAILRYGNYEAVPAPMRLRYYQPFAQLTYVLATFSPIKNDLKAIRHLIASLQEFLELAQNYTDPVVLNNSRIEQVVAKGARPQSGAAPAGKRRQKQEQMGKRTMTTLDPQILSTMRRLRDFLGHLEAMAKDREGIPRQISSQTTISDITWFLVGFGPEETMRELSNFRKCERHMELVVHTIEFAKNSAFPTHKIDWILDSCIDMFIWLQHRARYVLNPKAIIDSERRPWRRKPYTTILAPQQSATGQRMSAQQRYQLRRNLYLNGTQAALRKKQFNKVSVRSEMDYEILYDKTVSLAPLEKNEEHNNYQRVLCNHIVKYWRRYKARQPMMKLHDRESNIRPKLSALFGEAILEKSLLINEDVDLAAVVLSVDHRVPPVPQSRWQRADAPVFEFDFYATGQILPMPRERRQQQPGSTSQAAKTTRSSANLTTKEQQLQQQQQQLQQQQQQSSEDHQQSLVLQASVRAYDALQAFTQACVLARRALGWNQVAEYARQLLSAYQRQFQIPLQSESAYGMCLWKSFLVTGECVLDMLELAVEVNSDSLLVPGKKGFVNLVKIHRSWITRFTFKVIEILFRCQRYASCLDFCDRFHRITNDSFLYLTVRLELECMRNLAFDENFMLIMKRERNERLSKRPVDPECELIAVHQSLTCLVYQKLFGGGQMVDNEQVLKVLGKYRMLLEEASKERNHFVAVDALRDLGDLHYDIIGGGNGACLEQSRQFWSKSVELLLMSGLPAGSSGGSIKSWLQFSAFDLVGQKITLERCLKTIMDLGKLSMFAYRKDYDKKLEMAVVGSQLLHSLLCSRVNDPFDETLLTNFVKNHADLNELRNVALLLKSFQVLAKSLLDYSTDYAESALLMALFLKPLSTRASSGTKDYLDALLIQIQALLAIKAYDRVTAVISSLLDCTCWPRDYLRYFKLQPIKRQSTLTNPAILEGLSEYYGREFATRIQLMASYLPTEQAPSDKQQFSSARRYVQSVVMKYPESSSVNDAIEACLLLARLYVKDSGKDLDAAKVINHFLGRFSAHFTSGQQRQPTASGVVSTAAAATTVDVSLWIRLLVDFARYIGKGGGSKKHVALIIEEAKYISATVNSSYLAGLLARIEHEFAVNTIKN